MKSITPTLAICATALAGAAALLALPADRPPTPDPPTDDRPSTDLVIESFTFITPAGRAGAIVPIVNRDGEEHTVTADDGTFDITIAPGANATFDAPSTAGTYTFVCLIHPSMSGALTVT